MLIRLFLLALWGVAGNSLGNSFAVAPVDNIPWEFPLPSRVIAVGDIHADPDALKAILRHTKVVDEKDRWIAGPTHLVLMGDLNGRGPSARQVYDLVIRLTTEARNAGGQVHALLGNHELLIHQLDFKYASHTECEEWRDFAKHRKEMASVGMFMSFGTTAEKSYGVAMTRGEPYASFNANRNAIIKLGPILFVHGGLDNWLLDHSPANINATVRLWIDHYQGRRGLPDDKYGWVLNGDGPLWKKEISKKAFLKEEQVGLSARVRSLLKAVGATHGVVGHVVTPSREIEAALDGQWIMIDTGISRAMHGKLSALEIKDGAWVFHNDIPRPEGGHGTVPSCPQLVAETKPRRRK